MKLGGAFAILGIFDSGLGGLTVLRNVRARLPLADLVYLADQAHVPYGNRSEDDLVRLLGENVAFLNAAGVDAIVMGCNTSCAVAARRGWPPSTAPVLDLIVAAADAVAGTQARRIGVLATTATARSGAYGDALRLRAPSADVQEVAAPALVPLVESGILEGPVARAAVRDALAAFALPLDVLVLACTHYPLLEREIAAALPGVALLDPAVAQAARAAEWVRANGRSSETGRTRFVTTGPLGPFRRAVETIAGSDAPLAALSFERAALKSAGRV